MTEVTALRRSLVTATRPTCRLCVSGEDGVRDSVTEHVKRGAAVLQVTPCPGQTRMHAGEVSLYAMYVEAKNGAGTHG